MKPCMKPYCEACNKLKPLECLSFFAGTIKTSIRFEEGCTLPAMGILKGSVQKTNFLARLSRLVLTAMESSMGSSGGMTLVIIIVQFRKSLKRFLSGSCATKVYFRDKLELSL